MNTPSGGASHPVVVSPGQSALTAYPAGVALVEPGRVSPGVTHPKGFVAGGVVAGLKESGRPDAGVVAVAAPWREASVSAALLTTNAFAAAPVVVDRTETDLGNLVAIALNSGNANACTGEQGLVAARGMQRACAAALGVAAERVAVGSTGIIGVQIDAAALNAGVAKAAATAHDEGGPEFSRSMMTTDRFPKACAVVVETAQGPVRIGACAKGAGMISPAMATMLCVVTTDAVLDHDEAWSLLQSAVDGSFNMITVDGEMSTNDSVFLLASGASEVHPAGEDLGRFAAGLHSVLLRLALMMVADGEGATKIMRLVVEGAEDEGQAKTVARAIADSPLVKTAMNGCDPNWGRILSSAGAALAGRSLPATSLSLCGVNVVRDAAANPLDQAEAARLAEAMREPEVDIALDLGLGEASAGLFFADLGHEYISINAEYHT